MKRVLPACGFLFFIQLILEPATVLAKKSQPGPECPHFLVVDGDDSDQDLDEVPTTPFGPKCRLDQDVVGLAKTFELPSGIKLDCKGHKITPASSGQPGNSNTRSTPELAVFLNEAEAAEIKNCVIEGFDHGILAAGDEIVESNSSSPNQIKNNVVTARFVAIHLVAADHIKIKDNQLFWQTRGGIGIFIHHNSDGVDIVDNEITGDFPASRQGAVLMPGPTLSSNPVFNMGHGAVLISETLGPHPQLFTAIINGELFQFKASERESVEDSFTEDTLVENNAITFRVDNTSEDGIVASSTIGSVIRGNRIGKEDGSSRMRQAIRAGGNSGFQRLLPGHCVDKDRYCLSDVDCNIPGFDEGVADACPPLEQISPVWIPQNLNYEDNTIYGPFVSAMATVGNISIQGNSVQGKRPAGVTANFGTGITLAGKFSLEDAVIRRNEIRDVDTAVRFNNVFSDAPAFFGAKFSLNDLIGYTKAVTTSNDYALASELSVDAQGNVCSPHSSDCQGNHWGLSCPLGFDSTKAIKDNGSPASVTDSHSFGEPVSGFPNELLPQVCE